MKRTFGVTVCMAMLAMSCGYHLVGHGAFLPDYVRTVGVPTFQNRTSQFALEQKITDAVVREFSRRGSFEIVPRESNVDAVLAGTITSFSAYPVGFSPDGRANRFQVTVTAQVALLDARAQKVIYQNDSFSYSDDYDLDFGGSVAENASAFFDRESESVDEIADGFAENVVIAILEGF